jgi:hypothetical protein
MKMQEASRRNEINSIYKVGSTIEVISLTHHLRELLLTLAISPYHISVRHFVCLLFPHFVATRQLSDIGKSSEVSIAVS